MASPISSDSLSAASMFLGAMFLPPAVMMISFLRPVIVRKPSLSNAPRSPEHSQPSLSVSAVACGLLVVAEEHVGAAHQDLAVLGDLDLEPGQRRPDRADLGLARQVVRRRAGVLGLAVDLADRQVDAREELQHVGRDRGGARAQHARAVEAERGLELADHQPVGERVLRLRASHGTGSPRSRRALTSVHTRRAQSTSRLLAAGDLAQPRRQPGVELLPDPRHAEEHRRAALLEVVGDLLDRLREVHRAARGRRHVDRAHLLGDVRQRQVRQRRRRRRPCRRRCRSASCAVHARLACDSITPLGGPVVPEV